MAAPEPQKSEAKSKKAKTASTSTVVAGFTALPLTLPALPGLPSSCADAKHYIYVKAHAPAISTASTNRSLFIANIPIDASEANLRTLFAEQLGGARVESVDFDSSIPAVVEHKRFKPEELKGGKGQGKNEKRGTKRKREERKGAERKEIVAEGVVEDEDSALPRIWNGGLRKSGGCAVVVFLDKASMRGALKEVQSAADKGKTIRWTGGEALGIERYKAHLALVHPPPTVLTTTTNAYLSQFDAAQLQRNRALAHLRAVPDEEGFITVTRGGGRSAPAARLEIAQQKQAELEERKKKKGSLDGFYRFQNRENRKEEEGRLRRQFEKDRRRVVEMRERRGAVRPES